jgi:uncharacterized protein YkwD
MLAKKFLGKRTAAVVLTAIVGLGLTACLPPKAAPAPAPPASGGSPSDPFTASMLSALNADRSANGLATLSWNTTLANSAASWSQQMGNANNLSHQNLGALLSSPPYAGFNTLGENILDGPGSMTAGALENAWMNSPPHRANITSPSFNVVGIGYFRGPDGRIWAAQEFGGT